MIYDYVLIAIIPIIIRILEHYPQLYDEIEMFDGKIDMTNGLWCIVIATDVIETKTNYRELLMLEN